MGLFGHFSFYVGGWGRAGFVESLFVGTWDDHPTICHDVYCLWDYDCYILLVFGSAGGKLWAKKGDVDGFAPVYHRDNWFCWYGDGSSGLYVYARVLWH